MTAPTLTEPRVAPGPPAPAPRPQPLGRLLFGGLLVLFGVAWLLEAAGVYELRWQSALAIALMAVGVALLATARSGSHGGLVALGMVLTPAVIVVSLVPGVHPFSGAGERVYAPTTIAAVEPSYELGAGPMTLDLRDLVIPPGERVSLSASVGLGELTVHVPRDVAVEVFAATGGGDVTIFDREWNGLGVDVAESFPGAEAAGRLLLDLSVGLGAIEVTR
jgi:hypothetical protein